LRRFLPAALLLSSVIFLFPPPAAASAAWGVLTVYESPSSANYDLDTDQSEPGWTWEASTGTFTLTAAGNADFDFYPSPAFPHGAVILRYTDGAGADMVNVNGRDVRIEGDGSGAVLRAYVTSASGDLTAENAHLKPASLAAGRNILVTGCLLEENILLTAAADLTVRDTDIMSVPADTCRMEASRLTIEGRSHIDVRAVHLLIVGVDTGLHVDLDRGGYIDVSADSIYHYFEFGSRDDTIRIAPDNAVVIPDPYRIEYQSGLTQIVGDAGIALHVRIESRRPYLLGVTVTPAETEGQPGENLAFTAAVTGEYDPPSDVTWQVSGASDPDTRVTPAGVLIIGDNETAGVLIVTATSVFDSSKSASARVTVSRPSSAGIPDTGDRSPLFPYLSALLPGVLFTAPFSGRRAPLRPGAPGTRDSSS